MYKKLIPLIFTLIILGFSLSAKTSMTVYNQNIASVKTDLLIPVQKGINHYDFSDIPAGIEPTSVHLVPQKKSDKLIITLQNYEYDLASSDKILDKYIDKTISVVTKSGKLFSGILKSNDYEAIVIQNDDGIDIITRDEIQNIQLDKMPEDFYSKPTLNWELYSNKNGDCKTELSYITQNISWNAQYIGVLAPDDEKFKLSSWISLDNRSGKNFRDVDLKLMAGDIHRTKEKKQGGNAPTERIAFSAKGVPEIEEKEFFEYHLYTVKNKKINIKNNQQKQLTLFDPTEVKIKKIFRYNCNSNGAISVKVKFWNKKKNGLGIPLPKGKFRIFKDDESGNSEFIGEDIIAHTPRNEEVELSVGNAFDLKGECTLIHSSKPSTKSRKKTYEIELRNQKKDDVEIKVMKNLGRNWDIQNSDLKYEKKDAYNIQFKVDVPAEEKKIFEFTVLYTY